MKKTILMFLLITFVAGGWAVYHLFTAKTPDIVDQEPEIKTKAGEMIAAFNADALAASKKYINKIVAVTGNIQRIDTSGAIVLGERGSPSSVVAGIDFRHIGELASLKENEPITIQGLCTGYTKGAGDDLLASLGTTVELHSAGVKPIK